MENGLPPSKYNHSKDDFATLAARFLSSYSTPAAKAKNAYAQMCECLEEHEEAFRYYQQAYKAGNATARENLARWYEHGIHVMQDHLIAKTQRGQIYEKQDNAINQYRLFSTVKVEKPSRPIVAKVEEKPQISAISGFHC